MMKRTDKIYVAGHASLVGSAIIRRLRSLGFEHIVTSSSRELDLRNQEATRAFFREERPRFVFVAAARVGGILSNSTFTAEFTYDRSRPNGTSRKLLDVSSLAAMGWKPRVYLEEGIARTYQWFAHQQQ